LGFLLLALLSPPLEGQEKPMVGVKFRIEAQDFQRNLYKSIPAIEKDLAEVFTKLGIDEFEFLGWQLGDIQNKSRVAAILSVSLTAREPKSLGWTIWLRFSAAAGPAGSVYGCIEGFPLEPRFLKVNHDHKLDRPLFSQLDPQPTGNAEALRKKISDTILDEEQGFRTAISDAFLSQIPFCRNAKPHGVKGLLKIGGGGEDLDLGESSVIRLRLCSSIPEGREPSTLELKVGTWISLKKDKDPALPQASISRCTVGGSEKQREACILEVPRIFQKPLATDLFMVQFNKSEFQASGKWALTPGKRANP